MKTVTGNLMLGTGTARHDVSDVGDSELQQKRDGRRGRAVKRKARRPKIAVGKSVLAAAIRENATGELAAHEVFTIDGYLVFLAEAAALNDFESFHGRLLYRVTRRE